MKVGQWLGIILHVGIYIYFLIYLLLAGVQRRIALWSPSCTGTLRVNSKKKEISFLVALCFVQYAAFSKPKIGRAAELAVASINANPRAVQRECDCVESSEQDCASVDAPWYSKVGFEVELYSISTAQCSGYKKQHDVDRAEHKKFSTDFGAAGAR